jgi:hypothetical protein
MLEPMRYAEPPGETNGPVCYQSASGWRLIKLWGVMNLSESGK